MPSALGLIKTELLLLAEAPVPMFNRLLTLFPNYVKTRSVVGQISPAKFDTPGNKKLNLTYPFTLKLSLNQPIYKFRIEKQRDP